MALSIRQAEIGDAKAIATIHVDSSLAAYRGLLPDRVLAEITPASRSARWQQTLHQDQAAGVMVADQDDSAVGFCVVAVPSRDEDVGEGSGEIIALYVSPTVWRAGVGTALINEALRDFERGGCQAASLWVLDGNARALSFYRRFGFEPDGATRSRASIGAQELRMGRSLRRSA